MTPGGELPDRLADNYSFAVVAYEVLFNEHPIFPKNDETRTMGTYSRIVAFNRLKAGDWRKPSKLTPDQLPVDMRAADLAALDAVFTRALGDPAQRYVHLGELIDDLSRAILNAETYELIRQMPTAPTPQPYSPPSAPRELPAAESFTVLEVTGSATQPETPTNLEAAPPASDAEEKGLRRLIGQLGRLIGRG